MQPDLVAFGVGEESHIADFGRYLCFGDKYPATHFFYLREGVGQVGVAIEVYDHTIHGGLMHTAFYEGTADLAAVWRTGKAGHHDFAHFHVGQVNAEHDLVKVLCSGHVDNGYLKPVECIGGIVHKMYLKQFTLLPVTAVKSILPYHYFSGTVHKLFYGGAIFSINLQQSILLMSLKWMFSFCLSIVASQHIYANALNDTSFTEEPISLKTTTGTINGTLCMPGDSANIAVALIIAGSGPTDRDGNGPGMTNNSLQLLAAALAKKGIASVRFDKRGIGSSEKVKDESDLVFDAYVLDAKAWITQLRADKRFRSVYVVGHSEGSLIGIISASAGAMGLVSVAGPGQSADKLLKTQLAAQPQAVRDICYPIIDSLVQGKQVLSVDQSLYALFRPSVQPYLISWFRHDPVSELKRLTIPVLILQGTSDLQVSADDARRLSAADPKAKLVLVDGMNHVLKIVGNDRSANMSAYTNPSLPVSPVLVQSIVDFIAEQP